jgi:DNA polymerase III delta prime subunit
MTTKLNRDIIVVQKKGYMMIENSLWVEKYRPKTLDEYVWTDESQKTQVMTWVKEKEIPNLLLSGSAGVGKTTLAKCLFNELDVDPTDIRYVNASHHTGVDYYRGLGAFIETMASGNFRYILLDEADYLSPSSQAILRSMIEEYSNVCRWILTCNYPHKIIPALHSRTQGFNIEDLDREQFVTRAATILISEGIDLQEENLEILDEYVEVTYPDLRKCINLLQQNCGSGELKRPGSSSGKGSSEYMVNAVAMFKVGKIHEARKLICDNATPEEYEDIYRLLYRNLDWWGSDEDTQNKAIVIIANRLKDHALVADPEIALAACLVELSSLV